MIKILILVVLTGFTTSCSHSTKSQELTGCRIHNLYEYLDYPSCFDGVNPDGTHQVKSEILARLDFSFNKKWVSYYDFTRKQPPSTVHSNIVNGYILPNGKARDVIFFDNGPDYFEDGLARFISQDGKTGFINEELQIVIPATHDFVAPFRGGKAFFCDGCSLVGKGEHPEVKGGKWGIINKNGKIIRGPTSKDKLRN